MGTNKQFKTKQIDSELEKIKEGMKLVTQKLIAYKKMKGTDLIVLEGNKIVRKKP